jgi:para-nitrobenzyl esterase
LPPERAGELQTIPAERLLEAINARDPVLPFGSVSFAPVLDERTLKRHPFYPDAPPQSAQIPMIIGNTHDETRAFLGGDQTNSRTGTEVSRKLAPNTSRHSAWIVIAKHRRLYPHYWPVTPLFAATTADAPGAGR